MICRCSASAECGVCLASIALELVSDQCFLSDRALSLRAVVLRACRGSWEAPRRACSSLDVIRLHWDHPKTGLPASAPWDCSFLAISGFVVRFACGERTVTGKTLWFKQVCPRQTMSSYQRSYAAQIETRRTEFTKNSRTL